MSVFKKGLVLMVALMACLSNAQAQESAELQALHRLVIQACPSRWEELAGYINHDIDHLESRMQYSETDHGNRLDIWAGDVRDRQNYIKFALSYFTDENGEVLDNYTHIASILYGCGIIRHNYFAKLSNERYLETISFSTEGRKDEFVDGDGVMNAFDKCLTTSSVGVTEGSGQFPIFLDVAEEVINVDLAEGSPTRGCAAWEALRDGDDDGVTDHYDFCLDVFGAATTTDGCADADSDGQSDPNDPYPYQNDTMCVGGGE